MAEISEKELNLVSSDIDQQGLTYTRLKNELLDHICCNVENYMNDGLTFNEAYRKVKREMGSRRIRQVQDATLFLINQKYRRMKRTMLVLGISTAVIIIIGTILKMLHWPGAGILLTLGLASLSLAFIPLFVMVKIRDTRVKKKEVNLFLLVTGLIAGTLFSMGSLLKIQHWPGANITLGTSLIFGLLFLVLFVAFMIKDKTNWIENFTYIMLIAMFFAFVNLVYIITNNSKAPLIDGLTISEGAMGINSGYLETQSKFILSQIEKSEDKKVFDQMLTLKAEADQICSLIQSAKLEIVTGENEDNNEAIGNEDQIDFWQVRGRASGNEVYQVMFGDNGKGKAMEMRLLLESYKESALNLSQNEITRSFIESALCLDLDEARNNGSFPKEKDNVNWEESRFLYFPLILAASNLSQMEELVRLIELEVLRELSL